MRATFLKKKPQLTQVALQITSMADIFIILLVFLLKSFSTSVVSTTLSKNTRLPVAAAGAQTSDSLKLEISPTVVLIDEQPIVSLKELSKTGLHVPQAEKKLFDALWSQRRKGHANRDSSLLVMADERTPYSTLKQVLHSAAASGYVDLKLVVVKKD